MRRAAVGAAVLVAACSAGPATEPPDDDPPATARPYREAALAAGRWIRSTAIVDDAGTRWPADPLDGGTVVSNLYTGTPGVVLYFLEAHRATGDESWLDDARSGADWLLTRLDGESGDPGPGLYTGVAGIGFTLLEVWKAIGEPRYREGALRTVEILRETAVGTDGGVRWNDTTDIISGAAGTGLFLLQAHRELDADGALELAIAAGVGLVGAGETADGGRYWLMQPGHERNMPNFSHGTAGVAYFLARLHEATGDAAFLEAAVAGARYLQSVADLDGDACLILHHEPGGEDLYYLSWCHGPAGTARTFQALWRITGRAEWRLWVDRLATGVLESGVPEERTPGFWENVGQCCGDAGVAEFFLALHRETGEVRHLEFARRVGDDILARATPADEGLMWIQAEHRVQPELLVAQTGYMQGAAGIGILLFHLDAAEHGGAPGIRLPDAPW